MRKNIIIKVAIALIILVLIALWNIHGYPTNNQKKSIKIGVIMPLTGTLSEPGHNILDGILLAVEMYNDTCSEDCPLINLIIEDSKSTSIGGVAALNKLIFQDKVGMVIGDLSSEIFLACAPIAERNKMVMISPGASSPKVREAGDYIFRDYLSDEFDGKVMANYIYSRMAKNRCALIHINGDYGIGVAEAFTKEFERLGGNIVFKESYSAGTTDYKTTIVKMKKSNPDVIYIVGNPAENGYLVKQLKPYGVNLPITGNLGFENYDFIEVAKESFDSIIFSTAAFDVNSESEVVSGFVNEYKKKYHKSPDMTAGLGFDSANILIYCLKSNSYDLSNVKDKLYMLKDYDGVTGVTSFDEYGDVLKDIYIKKIIGNGDIYFIESYKYIK